MRNLIFAGFRNKTWTKHVANRRRDVAKNRHLVELTDRATEGRATRVIHPDRAALLVSNKGCFERPQFFTPGLFLAFVKATEGRRLAASSGCLIRLWLWVFATWF